MRIGLPRDTYAEKRCVRINSDHEYVNCRLIDKVLYLRAASKLLKFNMSDCIFQPLLGNGIDIYHSFNNVCITSKKWLVTYETLVPRVEESNFRKYDDVGDCFFIKSPRIEKYLKYLERDNCLSLNALSTSNHNMQKLLLDDYPQYKSNILEKMKVVHPPQELFTYASNSNESLSKPAMLKFIFVGRDFYRKGGAEIVLAFQELLDEGSIDIDSVHVTLVGDYKRFFNEVFYQRQDDIEFHNKIINIAASSKLFSLNESLPNSTVLEMIKDSHVGLLPTWRDTYGYSVLEFQSMGCPVISSNIRALPEINNNECGWIFDAGVNNLGEIYIVDENDKSRKRRKIIDGIKNSVREILRRPEDIYIKRSLSINKISVEHDPQDYINKIQSIIL